VSILTKQDIDAFLAQALSSALTSEHNTANLSNLKLNQVDSRYILYFFFFLILHIHTLWYIKAFIFLLIDTDWWLRIFKEYNCGVHDTAVDHDIKTMFRSDVDRRNLKHKNTIITSLHFPLL